MHISSLNQLVRDRLAVRGLIEQYRRLRFDGKRADELARQVAQIVTAELDVHLRDMFPPGLIAGVIVEARDFTAKAVIPTDWPQHVTVSDLSALNIKVKLRLDAFILPLEQILAKDVVAA